MAYVVADAPEVRRRRLRARVVTVQPKNGPNPVAAFYESHDERARLSLGEGWVELVRVQELLRPALSPPPGRLLDVGGADGVHASWLTEAGYDVEIVDVVALHVDRARARGFAAHVGDARSLAYDDDSFDAVLLLGPLYHLRNRDDRMKALHEARRVLRSGGLLAAAAVSRMAVALDWLRIGTFDDPRAREVATRIAVAGADDSGWGEGVFNFHTAVELEEEVRTTGFSDVIIRGVEGPAWPLLDPACPPDDPLVTHVLELARLADVDPATVGASAHLLALAHA
jgi:ubiquinone/menaquinone biosynthesis C-methylase UbiE